MLSNAWGALLRLQVAFFGPHKQDKDAFLDQLLGQMTLPELVMQVHMMFAGNILGPNSDNSLYDYALRASPDPDVGIGVIHDWYPTESSYYNDVQQLNAEKSRLKIPFMLVEECLHGVGSFKQSMFPQAIGLAASWDEDLVWRVGRAIGTEARAIGAHACLAPVMDLAKEPRWGRAQEDWGEDFVLTSHMGVAYANGLSKNKTYSDPDAVVPVMKHFAAHGSPHGGLNAASYMGHGTRQVIMEMLTPFKAVFELGGAKGVMMGYHELDGIPAHVNPFLYNALDEMGYDGFVMADDIGIRRLYTWHHVSSSPADTIQQWFNAGGNLQFYDYSLDIWMNSTIDLVKNNTVPESTLRSHVRRMLSVKYDLGLFDDPYIPESIDYRKLTVDHIPITLEAAHKSFVLLENKNKTLPIKPKEQGIKKIALIGPFMDALNYGAYAGPWGEYPVDYSSTIFGAFKDYLKANDLEEDVELVTSWGADNWMYYSQHAIPGHHLFVDGVAGGLKGTYYSDTSFQDAVYTVKEAPNRDWGLYPPPGLPSNNFSAIWEGEIKVPVEEDVDGFIGVAVYPNNTAKLYIDDELVAQSELSTGGTVLPSVLDLSYVYEHATDIPPGGGSFTWKKGATHKIRVEFVAWNLWQKYENQNGINAQVELFWGLVDREDPVGKAVNVAKDADLIVLAVGANWNSDGESADRATLGLSPNQTELADAIFDLGKPVTMVLQGGRPFAIPEYYDKSAATLDAFFPGQSGGKAIVDVLFGEFSPGGRVPITVPYSSAQLPVYYNYKYSDHATDYKDFSSYPKYTFGYGLSYTTFEVADFNATSSSGEYTFTSGDTITFRATIQNTGDIAGSHVAQVYLLQRVSQISRALRQLVAFKRVYLEPGESQVAEMEVEVDRYMMILNRTMEWELETGDYTFALMDDGGPTASQDTKVTLTCIRSV